MIEPHSFEVKNALDKVGLIKVGLIDEVTYQSKFDLRPEMIAKFAGSTYSYPLWEHLSKGIAITYSFAWEWFETILAGKEVRLFFEPAETDKSFVFRDGKDLSLVLNECYRFTFYVTDEQISFLMAYNDHENLFACGTAEEWILSYLRDKGLTPKVWELV